MDIMKSRHSVRQYMDKKIEEDKRKILLDLVDECNLASGLNIQIIFDEPKCFGSLMAHYGKFSGVENYIALVGTKAPDLEEKAGYQGERIVLKAQELGLNTCWVALTHGKSAAKVDKGEKQVCIIALGYGETQGVSHKNKPLEEVCNCADDMPDWFGKGIDAALAAPTAMNQQKFYFTLEGDSAEAKIKGKGFCTKTDLGIVKYHFETASGRRVV
ncbi:MAG: nitroreductase family protein [Eubacteriaceae bacterium]|nr:nitroreductase family protein [Eubacteriaceae bacterium]